MSFSTCSYHVSQICKFFIISISAKFFGNIQILKIKSTEKYRNLSIIFVFATKKKSQVAQQNSNPVQIGNGKSGVVFLKFFFCKKNLPEVARYSTKLQTTTLSRLQNRQNVVLRFFLLYQTVILNFVSLRLLSSDEQERAVGFLKSKTEYKNW